MMYEIKSYDKKVYSKLMLNKLKVMRSFTPIYTPLGIQLKKASMCASTLTNNELKVNDDTNYDAIDEKW